MRSLSSWHVNKEVFSKSTTVAPLTRRCSSPQSLLSLGRETTLPPIPARSQCAHPAAGHCFVSCSGCAAPGALLEILSRGSGLCNQEAQVSKDVQRALFSKGCAECCSCKTPFSGTAFIDAHFPGLRLSLQARSETFMSLSSPLVS